MVLAFGVSLVLTKDIFAPTIVDHRNGIENTSLGDFSTLAGISRLLHLESLNHLGNRTLDRVTVGLEFSINLGTILGLSSTIPRTITLSEIRKLFCNSLRSNDDVFKVGGREIMVGHVVSELVAEIIHSLLHGSLSGTGLIHTTLVVVILLSTSLSGFTTFGGILTSGFTTITRLTFGRLTIIGIVFHALAGIFTLTRLTRLAFGVTLTSVTTRGTVTLRLVFVLLLLLLTRRSVTLTFTFTRLLVFTIVLLRLFLLIIPEIEEFLGENHDLFEGLRLSHASNVLLLTRRKRDSFESEQTNLEVKIEAVDQREFSKILLSNLEEVTLMK